MRASSAPAVRPGLARLRPSQAGLCPHGGGQRGMVTAEFAVVLPAVVLVLALSLGALGLALDQVRCVDAARAGARAASRGDSDGAVTLVARRAAPSGAVVSMEVSADLVRVSWCPDPAWPGVCSPGGCGRAPRRRQHAS